MYLRFLGDMFEEDPDHFSRPSYLRKAHSPRGVVINSDREGKMYVNIGEKLHSPSAALMKLVDCSHLNDFDDVCDYLALHAMEVVREVHAEGQPRHQGRLTIDNQRVMLNCPPAPEDGDDHGYIMIKMLSELSSELGIIMRREFRVCDEYDELHVREDVFTGPDIFHKEARVPKKYKFDDDF